MDTLKSGVFNAFAKQLDEEFCRLDSVKNSMNSEEEITTETYDHLPGYEKLKYFDEDHTDEEFMDIVIDKLSKIEGDITYKIFRA